MTNIPKKLGDLTSSTVKITAKINELIYYIQAKEEEMSFMLDIAEERGYWQGRKEAKEEASNLQEQVAEHVKSHQHEYDEIRGKCSCGREKKSVYHIEASKGEGKRVVMCNECMPPKPMNDHKYLKGVIIHERTDCPPDTLYMVNENLFDKPTPPEHEESPKEDEELRKVWDKAYKQDPHYCFSAIEEHIETNYISKEKANRLFKRLIYQSETPETLTFLVHLRQSLGLGD